MPITLGPALERPGVTLKFTSTKTRQLDWASPKALRAAGQALPITPQRDPEPSQPPTLFLLVEFGSCAFSCLFWDSSHFWDKILILGPWFLFVRSTRPWREWTFTWTSQEENKWSGSSKSDSCTKINSSLCSFQNTDTLILKLHMFESNQEQGGEIPFAIFVCCTLSWLFFFCAARGLGKDTLRVKWNTTSGSSSYWWHRQEKELCLEKIVLTKEKDHWLEKREGKRNH